MLSTVSEGRCGWYPDAGVRNDPIGHLNRFINRAFAGSLALPRWLLRMILHVEFPRMRHPVRLPHPYNVVVNNGVVFGSNVTIYQGVTVGSKRYKLKAVLPEIGDGVVVSPNAVPVGGIRVGTGAIVQAGAVVIDSVLPWAVVGGNPAKTIGFQNCGAQSAAPTK